MAHRRRSFPVTFWKEDFEAFVDCMGELITPYNESFAAVICGRAKRGGSGLFVESGLHLKKQIIEAFAAKNANDRAGNFRVKEFNLTSTNATQKKAGISGKRQEVVYFFWKGSWASKLPNLRRDIGGGSTYDDAMTRLPSAVLESIPSIPYFLKAAIFGTRGPDLLRK